LPAEDTLMNALRLPPLALLVVCGSFAIAQDREQPRENLTARGTLRGVFNGGFQLATDTNETWAVKLPEKAASISFSGTAEPSFLRPGLKVKFSAVMNKKGTVQEPVTAVTVFTPIEPKDIGIWPEGAGGESAPNPLQDLFVPKEVKVEPKKPGKKPVITEQVCNVGGTLKSFKAGRLTVIAGGKEVKCELADNAKIRVATSDLAFAQLGDKVEVEGWYYVNNKNAGLWAREVSVIAANPLEGEKKKVKTTDDETKGNEKPELDEKKLFELE
jgi:hypothetical protein